MSDAKTARGKLCEYDAKTHALLVYREPQTGVEIEQLKTLLKEHKDACVVVWLDVSVGEEYVSLDERDKRVETLSKLGFVGVHVFAESKDQLDIYQLKKKIEAEVLVSICNSKFSNIRKLSLTFYNCSFSTEIGKILVTIPNLDFVDMSGISGNSKVNSELMKILAQSKTLTGVAISGDKTFDDAALEALIQLQALEYLNVEYCNVSTEGIATVAATHRDTLKYLNIEGDFVITDLVLRELSNLPHLNTLFLPTTVDNAGMLQLSRGNAPLKYLGLRDNSSIDDFVFPTLVNIILQKRIEYINISGSNISHNAEIALHRLRAYAGVLEEGIESNCSEVSIEEDVRKSKCSIIQGT